VWGRSPVCTLQRRDPLDDHALRVQQNLRIEDPANQCRGGHPRRNSQTSRELRAHQKCPVCMFLTFDFSNAIGFRLQTVLTTHSTESWKPQAARFQVGRHPGEAAMPGLFAHELHCYLRNSVMMDSASRNASIVGPHRCPAGPPTSGGRQWRVRHGPRQPYADCLGQRNHGHWSRQSVNMRKTWTQLLKPTCATECILPLIMRCCTRLNLL
jgi:hypothetical protein